MTRRVDDQRKHFEPRNELATDDEEWHLVGNTKTQRENETNQKKNHIKACGFINQLFKINCTLVKYI